MKHLKEQLILSDNKTFIKDCKSVDKIIKEYIEDRKEMYSTITDSTLDDDNINLYKEYFCSYASEYDTECHPYLYRIIHFLQRDYESYLEGKISKQADEVLSSIIDVQYEDFENDEFEFIKRIEEEWKTFMDLVLATPILDVKNMDFENLYGVSIYKSKECDDFTNETFETFMETLHRYFPNTLTRLDAIVIADEEYIHLVGDGKYSKDGSTCAYYTDGCLFLANKLHRDEEDSENEAEKFSTLVWYHEFSHFIYQQLSETSQIYWTENYNTWRKEKVKLPRDDDRNSQLWADEEKTKESNEYIEECFADENAVLLYNTTKFGKDNPLTDNDYIHMPSSIVASTVDFVIRNEFNIKRYIL